MLVVLAFVAVAATSSSVDSGNNSNTGRSGVPVQQDPGTAKGNHESADAIPRSAVASTFDTSVGEVPAARAKWLLEELEAGGAVSSAELAERIEALRQISFSYSDTVLGQEASISADQLAKRSQQILAEAKAWHASTERESPSLETLLLGVSPERLLPPEILNTRDTKDFLPELRKMTASVSGMALAASELEQELKERFREAPISTLNDIDAMISLQGRTDLVSTQAKLLEELEDWRERLTRASRDRLRTAWTSSVSIARGKNGEAGLLDTVLRMRELAEREEVESLKAELEKLNEAPYGLLRPLVAQVFEQIGSLVYGYDWLYDYLKGEEGQTIRIYTDDRSERPEVFRCQNVDGYEISVDDDGDLKQFTFSELSWKTWRSLVNRSPDADERDKRNLSLYYLLLARGLTKEAQTFQLPQTQSVGANTLASNKLFEREEADIRAVLAVEAVRTLDNPAPSIDHIPGLSALSPLGRSAAIALLRCRCGGNSYGRDSEQLPDYLVVGEYLVDEARHSLTGFAAARRLATIAPQNPLTASLLVSNVWPTDVESVDGRDREQWARRGLLVNPTCANCFLVISRVK